MLQPHYLGSGRESHLSLLILLSPDQELVFFPSQNFYCPAFIPHFDYFHQLMMHSSPASTACSYGSSTWPLSFLSELNSHLAIPSLLPHFSMASTSSLTSGIVLAPPATSGSLILPPSIIASLLLLHSGGCQLCPPARVFLHALLSCLLMLQMGSFT